MTRPQQTAPTILSPALLGFLRDLADVCGEKVVNEMRHAFIALSNEGLENPDADAQLLVLDRIAAQPRSLRARFESMADVCNQKGRITVHVTDHDVSILGRTS
jgi:hypothetical protein